MALKMGQINVLEVDREADISYILTDGLEEIFLHKKQATRKLTVGEEIEVFLYYDNQKRITATMTVPFINTEKGAFLEVVDVNPRLGVFLHMGIQKDLLLSRDDLPFKKIEWPNVGDKIFAKIRVSKSQLTAKIINRYDLHQHILPTKELEKGETVDAYVLFFAEEGIVLATEEGHLIFVYFKHIRKPHHLGQKTEVKIVNVKENFQYNGMLIEQKEIMMTKDAEFITAHLKRNQGMMEYTDKSTPEEIYSKFNMSKKAFKRALGVLYKEKLITIHEDSVELNAVEEAVELKVGEETNESTS